MELEHIPYGSPAAEIARWCETEAQEKGYHTVHVDFPEESDETIDVTFKYVGGEMTMFVDSVMGLGIEDGEDVESLTGRCESVEINEGVTRMMIFKGFEREE